MSSANAELEHEWELEGEFEHEHEHEHEHENEHEAEAEAFFNHLSAMADRGGRSQALRRVAMAAAREAMRGAMQAAPAIEGELEGEHEFELELEFDPVRRTNLDLMMEHMAHAASESESEQEAAEHFLPLIPLAAKFALPLLGKALPFAGKALAKFAPKLLGKVVPNLTRGIGNLARSLFRNRSTRPMLRALPRIARTTMATLGRSVAQGRSITPQAAARALATQAARTLSNPQILTQSYRRSVARDRRFHRQSTRLLGRPGPASPGSGACSNCGCAARPRRCGACGCAG